MDNKTKITLVIAIVLIFGCAVVMLVPTLIGIGLMGQFTGFGSAGLEQQSKAYWESASPFSITSAKIGTDKVQLEVQNKLSKKLVLLEVFFDGDALGIGAPLEFAPGESKIITSSSYTTPCTEGGQVYQINTVVFTYDADTLANQTQSGNKPLYGKCS